MKFQATPLSGAFLVELEPIRDERGLFARTFCKNEFAEIGHTKEFAQFNYSVSLQKGTLRGMHFQVPPSAEIKLLRCVRGSVFDVIVDIRKESPTFLKWFGAELSAENMLSMYVPEGFAHGFLTLTENAQLIYHHTEFYAPQDYRGIRWNDPSVGIEWPEQPTNLTEKDQNLPLIEEEFGL